MLIIDCPELEAQIRREYGTLNMLVNNDFMMEQTKMDSVASYVKEQTKIAKKIQKKAETTVYQGKGRPRGSDYTASGTLRVSEKKKSKSSKKTIECPICYEKKSNYTTFNCDGKHVMCNGCYKSWVDSCEGRDLTCAMCRQVMKTS